MKVPYVCCSKKLEDHYASQVGHGLPYYRGISYQKGYGLGGIFRRIFRAALPYIVRGTKTVGKEALVTGSRVMSDVLAGQDIKTAAKNRTKESGKNLAKKALSKMQSMIGSGGYKRKRKTKKKIISSKKLKGRGRDIFDSP